MNKTHYDDPVHMMEKQGGSFVKALANLYYCADPSNRARVIMAFADYFENYGAKFDAWKKRQGEQA